MTFHFIYTAPFSLYQYICYSLIKCKEGNKNSLTDISVSATLCSTCSNISNNEEKRNNTDLTDVYGNFNYHIE